MLNKKFAFFQLPHLNNPITHNSASVSPSTPEFLSGDKPDFQYSFVNGSKHLKLFLNLRYGSVRLISLACFHILSQIIWTYFYESGRQTLSQMFLSFQVTIKDLVWSFIRLQHMGYISCMSFKLLCACFVIYFNGIITPENAAKAI